MYATPSVLRRKAESGLRGPAGFCAGADFLCWPKVLSRTRHAAAKSARAQTKNIIAVRRKRMNMRTIVPICANGENSQTATAQSSSDSVGWPGHRQPFLLSVFCSARGAGQSTRHKGALKIIENFLLTEPLVWLLTRFNKAIMRTGHAGARGAIQG